MLTVNANFPVNQMPPNISRGEVLTWWQQFWITTIKSFISKDNSNNNENGKKTIGLYWHNNNFECASRFFSSNMELPDFMHPLYGVGEYNTKNFFS